MENIFKPLKKQIGLNDGGNRFFRRRPTTGLFDLFNTTVSKQERNKTMHESEFQAWMARMERLTPQQRESALDALKRYHPGTVEPVFYTDDEPIVVRDKEPSFFSQNS
ncbi:MAG: hypothetical protein G8237_12635 [Magnetococcales bacterium]|nr:hypothetical protein [Magnetococcales bacterium]NGZ07190.1 hypothetical protein [Magnetococcales bacterium]